ncbi:MAG TPA: hypothetical protein VJ648_04390 [Vicinamibacteria bacterium]|nr:hypothetical protein [Vicinamibacteria bacterium]
MRDAGPDTGVRRELLRHALATLAYRGGKAVRGAPDSFGSFHLAATSRTPVQILAHIGDLLDWALSLARGQEAWRESAPLAWPDEVSRFYDGLARLDAQLAAEDPKGASVEQLFQGPIADALTHVGQLTLLRRLAGSPVRGENYLRADIAPGRVGPRQEPARREFE